MTDTPDWSWTPAAISNPVISCPRTSAQPFIQPGIPLSEKTIAPYLFYLTPANPAIISTGVWPEAAPWPDSALAHTKTSTLFLPPDQVTRDILCPAETFDKTKPGTARC